MERKETQPPQRYSETSLVGLLERNGVGRPSTYAQIVSTLYDRKYVERVKRTLVPTELGMSVSRLLVSTLGALFDVKFTAGMEEKLDEIEKGNIEWRNMLAEFYAVFSEWMKKTKGPAADRREVSLLLEALGEVREWEPEVKRGSRTYSDARFVESIRGQAEKGQKPVSERQFEALLRIAVKYREQTRRIEKALREVGREDVLDEPAARGPAESTVRKLDALATVELDASAERFVSSLRDRVASGRALSEAQLRVLNTITMTHARAISNYEALEPLLDLGETSVPEDAESKTLLDALQVVREWRPPTTRGRKVFDDQAFYRSLSEHYARKRFLSERQKAALKRLVARYRGQIGETAKEEHEPAPRSGGTSHDETGK